MAMNRQIGVPTDDIVADTLAKLKGEAAPPNNPCGRGTLSPAAAAHMILTSYITGQKFPGLREAVDKAYGAVQNDQVAVAEATAAPIERARRPRRLEPMNPSSGEWCYSVGRADNASLAGWSKGFETMRAAKNSATQISRVGDQIVLWHRGLYGQFESFIKGKCKASGRITWENP